MNATRLGPPLHQERGYRVREVFDTGTEACVSAGFTFEGPDFNALIIYAEADEALAAMRMLLDSGLPLQDQPGEAKGRAEASR
jgi:hypothetical protein